jgi:hypothetical protein
MKNLWFRLLFYWCYEKTPIGSGLTIPYFIGTFKHLYNETISTEELLMEFSKNETNYFVCIEFCANINEYVIKLNDKEDLIQLKHYPRFGNFFILDEKLGKFQNINKISNYLENIYSVYIKDEKFSKIDGKFVKFTINDFEIINPFK